MNSEIHNVSGHRRGDKIQFICSCCDFVRIHNLKTGDITTNPGQKNIPHSGVYKAGKYRITFEPETKNPSNSRE